MARADPFDMQIKLLMIGDSECEKTPILLRYANGPFSPTFITTIGIDFKIKNIQLDDKKIKLQIWDTAGQERFRTITASYFRGAQGILLIYDVTNKKTFDSIKHWHAQILTYAGSDVKVVLVGANCDDAANRVVSAEQGMDLAKSFGDLPFFEVSSPEPRHRSLSGSDSRYSLQMTCSR